MRSFSASAWMISRRRISPDWIVSGVLDALDFLHQARRRAGEKREQIKPGQTVVILGGGNVALDAAVVARRSGADEVIVLVPAFKTGNARLGIGIPSSCPAGG